MSAVEGLACHRCIEEKRLTADLRLELEAVTHYFNESERANQALESDLRRLRHELSLRESEFSILSKQYVDLKDSNRDARVRYHTLEGQLATARHLLANYYTQFAEQRRNDVANHLRISEKMNWILDGGREAIRLLASRWTASEFEPLSSSLELSIASFVCECFASPKIAGDVQTRKDRKTLAITENRRPRQGTQQIERRRDTKEDIRTSVEALHTTSKTIKSKEKTNNNSWPCPQVQSFDFGKFNPKHSESQMSQSLSFVTPKSQWRPEGTPTTNVVQQAIIIPIAAQSTFPPTVHLLPRNTSQSPNRSRQMPSDVVLESMPRIGREFGQRERRAAHNASRTRPKRDASKIPSQISRPNIDGHMSTLIPLRPRQSIIQPSRPIPTGYFQFNSYVGSAVGYHGMHHATATTASAGYTGTREIGRAARIQHVRSSSKGPLLSDRQHQNPSDGWIAHRSSVPSGRSKSPVRNMSYDSSPRHPDDYSYFDESRCRGLTRGTSSRLAIRPDNQISLTPYPAPATTRSHPLTNNNNNNSVNNNNNNSNYYVSSSPDPEDPFGGNLMRTSFEGQNVPRQLIPKQFYPSATSTSYNTLASPRTGYPQPPTVGGGVSRGSIASSGPPFARVIRSAGAEGGGSRCLRE